MKKRSKEKDINKIDRDKRKRVQKRVYIIYGLSIIGIGQLISHGLFNTIVIEDSPGPIYDAMVRVYIGCLFSAVVCLICEIFNIETDWRYKLVDKLSKD